MECVASFELKEQLDAKTLKQQLKAFGVDIRRLSRFTQLALLGALSLKSAISADCAIYFGVKFNSVSKFFKMFDNLRQNALPSPLDFTANINNAGVFQVSQQLQINRQSVFLAVDKSDISQLFSLAELDLEREQTALIGWVYERTSAIENDESLWRVVRKKSLK